MAVKIVCDLCGEDADETEFILPSYEDCVYERNGQPIAKVCVGIKPRAINLCHDHMKQLADWIDIFYKRKFLIKTH